MSVSLHVKLRELEKFGTIHLKRDPERHLPGEGRYCYGGEPIQILVNQLAPPAACNAEVRFDRQHDLAWCNKTNTLLAYAVSTTEEFQFPDQAEAGSGLEVV